MTTSLHLENEQADDVRAAILVDYDDLYHCLHERFRNRDAPQVEEVVAELIAQLRHYLQDLSGAHPAVVNAYADFGALPGDPRLMQRTLFNASAKSIFVPQQPQRNAAELQLCVDAMELLHRSGKDRIHAFTILCGKRLYQPLVQELRRHGRTVLVVSIEPPQLSGSDDDVYLSAATLLNEETRRHLEPERTNGQAGHHDHEPVYQTREGATYEPVDEADDHEGLRIIHEFFGHYDEVYLTPLLRKMSEQMGPYADPKVIINSLEAHGAVWLEKRRGQPYDYTVLLVDAEHPDVQALRDELYGLDEDDADLGFDEGDFDEEDFDEDDYVYDEDEYDDEADYEDGDYEYDEEAYDEIAYDRDADAAERV